MRELGLDALEEEIPVAGDSLAAYFQDWGVGDGGGEAVVDGFVEER